MYTGEMWFGIVEKPHPSLILGAYHFSLLFQPTVIPVKALEVMISATLKCFFFFFLLCAPCSSTYCRRTEPAVKATAEPAASVGRCAIELFAQLTEASFVCSHRGSVCCVSSQVLRFGTEGGRAD